MNGMLFVSFLCGALYMAGISLVQYDEHVTWNFIVQYTFVLSSAAVAGYYLEKMLKDVVGRGGKES